MWGYRHGHAGQARSPRACHAGAGGRLASPVASCPGGGSQGRVAVRAAVGAHADEAIGSAQSAAVRAVGHTRWPRIDA
jgi:hypothetical protein